MVETCSHSPKLVNIGNVLNSYKNDRRKNKNTIPHGVRVIKIPWNIAKGLSVYGIFSHEFLNDFNEGREILHLSHHGCVT